MQEGLANILFSLCYYIAHGLFCCHHIMAILMAIQFKTCCQKQLTGNNHKPPPNHLTRWLGDFYLCSMANLIISRAIFSAASGLANCLAASDIFLISSLSAKRRSISDFKIWGLRLRSSITAAAPLLA